MLTRRRWSVSMDYRIGRLNRFITGWVAYFRLAQRVSVLGKLDGWLRRRLRQIRWKEWKTTAAKRHNLGIRGISESEARKWAGIEQENTGRSQAPRSSRYPCPTHTGTTSA